MSEDKRKPSIKINVGQQVNLFRTYQYVIEEEDIIETFGSMETFKKFVDGDLSEEEIENLELDADDPVIYLRSYQEYDHYDEDDDWVESEVYEITDGEPWDATRGRFLR